MSKSILHITNGNSLTESLKENDFSGEFLTWQEMLCEGPTIAKIDSQEFFEIRRQFLNECYDVEVDEAELHSELKKLDDLSGIDEIVLWFEFDLFCHINLIGVLNLLHQKEIDLPLYLVCSGRIPGEKGLKGLSELSPTQLISHFEDRVRLTNDDKQLAIALWRIYCGKDHNIFIPYLVKPSSFKYMNNCLKAHLKRFPDMKNGLSTIERNILCIVRDINVRSRHHLLGYALNYQGFYGYGDMQLSRIIDNMSIFFTEENSQLKLNRKGHEAVMDHHNFASELNNNMLYGGVNRRDYQFCNSQNKLIKTIINAY